MSRYFSRYRIAAPFGLLLALFFVAAAAAPADAGMYINKTADLAFGSLVAGSGGTVIIAPSNGARSKTGGVTLMSSTYQAARFTVGCSGLGCVLGLFYYTIDPVSNITLTSGGNHMTVSNFSPYSVNNNGSSTKGFIQLLGGTDTVKVGGTLNVGNNQAPGTYSGTFNVKVTYP